jgi:hypothetical protein
MAVSPPTILNLVRMNNDRNANNLCKVLHEKFASQNNADRANGSDKEEGNPSASPAQNPLLRTGEPSSLRLAVDFIFPFPLFPLFPPPTLAAFQNRPSRPRAVRRRVQSNKERPIRRGSRSLASCCRIPASPLPENQMGRTAAWVTSVRVHLSLFSVCRGQGNGRLV